MFEMWNSGNMHYKDTDVLPNWDDPIYKIPVEANP